jgi:type II secretory pathway pseudopilin PulG
MEGPAVIGILCFGALVALGAMSQRRKRREAEAREYVARHHAEQARHEATKAVAELEALRIKNPPAKRGRPAKTQPETETKP